MVRNKNSDITVKKYDWKVRLMVSTTNTIGAVFFLMLLSAIRVPNLAIKWKRGIPTAKYISEAISLSYYIDLNAKVWPWPIEPDIDELEKIIESFVDEEFAEFIAVLLDGDGTVWYDGYTVRVKISVCKNCHKLFVANILKNAIVKRFGIVGYTTPNKTVLDLEFSGTDAIKLLKRIARYMHHPLRKLRAELFLVYYDGKISREEFEKLYEQTEYEQGRPDIKRNHALEVIIQAAPQTHTHGEQNNY